MHKQGREILQNCIQTVLHTLPLNKYQERQQDLKMTKMRTIELLIQLKQKKIYSLPLVRPPTYAMKKWPYKKGGLF
jgi:hypothetical protein